MIKREIYIKRVSKAFRNHSVVALLGPRQCGKTTLARVYASAQNSVHVFDLENPTDLAQLQNPLLALEELTGLIIIDEIQRVPELFPVIRVLVDKPKSNKRFLILGSASRDLIKQSSESLAGRIAHIELTPFSYLEVQNLSQLWIRGGFPKSYLADGVYESFEWRKNYIATFLERDIPNLGIQISPQTLRRFWVMLSHYHANIFNASELGRSLGVAHTTIRHYIDILSGCFMIRQLQPWIANIKKRQVKAPKIYFRDSGILHSLMGIEDMQSLKTNPKLGASWEGLILEEIIRFHQVDPQDCYFWSTHSGAEIDLLIVKNGKLLGFEIKFTDSPALTNSMKLAQEELNLDKLTVIVPGAKDYPLTKKVRVIGIEKYLES